MAYQAADSSFYAIANDSNGSAELISFSLSSPPFATEVASLAAGDLWRGGLALGSGGLFYAIGTDADTYIPWFFSINPKTGVTTSLFALGDGSLGYNGGLTYDPADGFFYALASGESESALQKIGLGGSVTTAQLLGLSGYQGGVAYDAASGNFFAVRTDADSYAYLEQIAPGNATPVSEVYGFWVYNNWGFWNSSLAFASDGGQTGETPEPVTSGMGGLALACFCGIALKRRHKA